METLTTEERERATRGWLRYFEMGDVPVQQENRTPLQKARLREHMVRQQAQFRESGQ